MTEGLRGRAGHRLAILAACLLLAGDVATAKIGGWTAALEITVDYSHVENETNVSSASSESLRTEERLTFRNTNSYLYDPRFISLSFGGTVGLSQQSFSSDSSGSPFERSDDGELLGYEFFASLFQGQSLAWDVFANRDQSVITRELAGRTDVRTENRGASFFARRLFIPSSLRFRQEFTDEESETGAIVTRREERRDTLSYEGRRGWINSQMILRYELSNKFDEVRPELDYKTRDGSLLYSRDFGPRLNRRWDSRLRTFRRSGFSVERRAEIDELIRIDHGPRMDTELRYFYQDTERPEGDTTRHIGSYDLNHRLYDSLLTNFEFIGTVEEQPDGKRRLGRGRVGFSYKKELPGDVGLTAGLAGDYAYEDDRFETGEGTVFDESLTFATPFALPIALDNPGVVLASVEIVKVASGPPVPGCGVFSLPRPLDEGLDYTLQPIGDLAEIVPVPCTLSTPGINPGDTILVDYRFEIPPDLAFTTKSWRASIALDYGWLRPFYTHEQTDQSLVKGVDSGFLDDRETDRFGIELRRERLTSRASVLAQAGRYTSGDSAYESFRVSELFSYRIARGSALTVTGEQTRIDYTVPRNRETRIFGARATLTYPLGVSLFADAYAGLRDLEDTVATDERTIEVGGNLRWVLGKLEVAPSVKFIDRQRAGTDSRDYRAVVRMKRRF